MALQEGVVAHSMNHAWVKRFWVLIDRVEGDYFVGRTQYDSPEVDQEVFVTSEKALQIGEFYEVLTRKRANSSFMLSVNNGNLFLVVKK